MVSKNVCGLFLEIYSKRLEHSMRYGVDKTENGWEFDHVEAKVSTDKTAIQFFEYLHRCERISYPHNMGDFFEILWDGVLDYEVGLEEIQEKLNELGSWVSKCESEKPSW